MIRFHGSGQSTKTEYRGEGSCFCFVVGASNGSLIFVIKFRRAIFSPQPNAFSLVDPEVPNRFAVAGDLSVEMGRSGAWHEFHYKIISSSKIILFFKSVIGMTVIAYDRCSLISGKPSFFAALIEVTPVV
jgi:hypothetical protein